MFRGVVTAAALAPARRAPDDHPGEVELDLNATARSRARGNLQPAAGPFRLLPPPSLSCTSSPSKPRPRALAAVTVQPATLLHGVITLFGRRSSRAASDPGGRGAWPAPMTARWRVGAFTVLHSEPSGWWATTAGAGRGVPGPLNSPVRIASNQRAGFWEPGGACGTGVPGEGIGMKEQIIESACWLPCRAPREAAVQSRVTAHAAAVSSAPPAGARTSHLDTVGRRDGGGECHPFPTLSCD